MPGRRRWRPGPTTSGRRARACSSNEVDSWMTGVNTQRRGQADPHHRPLQRQRAGLPRTVRRGGREGVPGARAGVTCTPYSTSRPSAPSSRRTPSPSRRPRPAGGSRSPRSTSAPSAVRRRWSGWASRPASASPSCATTRATFFEVLFACGKAGAILVPLNWRQTPAELAPILADCGARLLLHDAATAELAAALARPAMCASSPLPITSDCWLRPTPAPLTPIPSPSCREACLRHEGRGVRRAVPRHRVADRPHLVPALHLRHHRPAQGRDPDRRHGARQLRQRAAGDRRSPRADRTRQLPAAVPHRRHQPARAARCSSPAAPAPCWPSSRSIRCST